VSEKNNNKITKQAAASDVGQAGGVQQESLWKPVMMLICTVILIRGLFLQDTTEISLSALAGFLFVPALAITLTVYIVFRKELNRDRIAITFVIIFAALILSRVIGFLL
jgi:hypothetical protein